MPRSFDFGSPVSLWILNAKKLTARVTKVNTSWNTTSIPKNHVGEIIPAGIVYYYAYIVMFRLKIQMLFVLLCLHQYT